MAKGTRLHPSPCPADGTHRRQLMVDAVAELDITAMHHLIERHTATVNDVQLAIEQTERDPDEVMTAYTDWLDEQSVAARMVNHVRALVAQPSLFSTEEVA